MHGIRRLLAHIVATLTIKKQRSNYVKNLIKYGVFKKLKEKRDFRKYAPMPKQFKYTLGVVAIMKNEGPYLREWIEFHKMMGVDKFFLYDNESNDDTKDILQPYIKSGLVEYNWFPGQKMQLPAYYDCVSRHKLDTKWLAIFDLDEYIVPVKHKTVKDFLETVKPDVAQVIIDWVIFGSNGHEKRPNGLVLENYTMRAKRNWLYKSIINPRLAMGLNCHEHDVAGKTIEPNINVIRMHHYHCKSWAEYVLKRSRGDAWNGNAAGDKKYQRACFDEHDKNDVFDGSALRFVPKLKRIINQ